MSERSCSTAPWDAFEGGRVRRRELRLSPQEVSALRRECPGAELEELSPAQGGRQWYRVTLEGVRQRV